MKKAAQTYKTVPPIHTRAAAAGRVRRARRRARRVAPAPRPPACRRTPAPRARDPFARA